MRIRATVSGIVAMAALFGLFGAGALQPPDAFAQTTRWVDASVVTPAAPGTGCGDLAGYATIGAALAASAANDTINICPGTYNESNLLPGQNRNLVGVAGSGGDPAAPGDVVVNAGGSGRVFRIIANGVSISNLTVAGGSATEGGGISNEGDNLTLTNVTVSGNTAIYGGGIDNYQAINVTLLNVTISGNTAGDGGGIYNSGGSMTLTGVTISGNSATGSGGGIFNDGGDFTLTNVTLSGNTATINGGGIYNIDGGSMELTHVTVSGNTASSGGGIYNTGSNTGMTLTNVTVSGNTASSGVGGGILRNAATGNVVTLRNTIVAGQVTGADCSGAVTSEGHNLDSDGSCGLGEATDIDDGAANLAPLANNGGATQTHALLFGSDAIDAGNNAWCTTDFDQRGEPRIFPISDGICDIGAFELQTSFGEVTVTKSANQATVLDTGGTVQFTATITNNTGVELVVASVEDDQFADLDLAGCATPPPATLANGGSYSCAFSRTLSGAAGSTHQNIVTVGVLPAGTVLGAKPFLAPSNTATVEFVVAPPSPVPTEPTAPTEPPTDATLPPAPEPEETPVPFDPGPAGIEPRLLSCAPVAQTDVAVNTSVTLNCTLTDQDGNPVPSGTVTFVITGQPGSDASIGSIATHQTTDAQGRASATLRPGSTPGTLTVEARSSGASSTRFVFQVQGTAGAGTGSAEPPGLSPSIRPPATGG